MKRLDISRRRQQPHHLRLLDTQNGAGRQRRGAAHPNRLPRQAALAEKVAGAEHRDHRLLAPLRQHRQLDAARLHVEHVVTGVALREDRLVASVADDGLRQSGRTKKRLGIEAGVGDVVRTLGWHTE
jgi:hypothetical protein